MSTYYSQTKGVVNRYWKRPKPRVYECNVRDAERFYQQSYKDYLEAKEYAAKKSSEQERSKLLGDDTPSRWNVRRSNSLLDPMADSVSRNTSGYESRSSYLNSNSRQYGDDALSGGSTYRMANSRSSQDTDMSSIEDRLQRLQKLRTDLGLPSENSGGVSKVTFAPTPSNRTFSPDPRERRGKTIDVMSDSSYSSMRSSNRSRGMDLTSDSYDDAPSSRSERSSRFASKYANDEDSLESKYRPSGKKYTNDDDSFESKYRPSRKKYTNDEDSFESKYRPSGRASSYSRDEPDSKYSLKSSLKNDRKYELNDSSMTNGDAKPFKSSRKVVTIDDDEECDADAYLSNIKKKFPTSDEILERIKKMDSDL